MSDARVLALVLAGGEGRRLRPLTDERPKPALDFGQGCRIVDFTLANLANSGVPWIYLLAQYKPAALIEHVARVWGPLLARRDCVLHSVLPAGSGGRFRGTADAVYRNLHLIERHRPEVVAVFAPITSTAWTCARWSSTTGAAVPSSPWLPCLCRSPLPLRSA